VSSIEIHRPPSEVFSYVTDPVRFAEWQNDVVSVRIEESDPLRVGGRFTTTRRMGSVNRTMTQQVTQIDPPSTWAVQGIDGPIRPNVTITVEPLEGEAWSRVTFALDFEGHGIGVPLVPIVRRLAAAGAPASYRNLKQRLETGDRHAG
jgi:uncharacterized protein YndB with AHSA1/START domain